MPRMACPLLGGMQVGDVQPEYSPPKTWHAAEGSTYRPASMNQSTSVH